jgi:hypothetical protein
MKAAFATMLVLTSLLGSAACDMFVDGGNSGSDSDSDTDSDGDVEVEWCDETSGLCWLNPPDDQFYIWQDDWQHAVDYCDSLSFAGFSDWRLPTVSELRSLVRGCDATMTGGTCGVTDGCLESGCMDGSCDGCDDFEGPGFGGCYWGSDVVGDCTNSFYWSSSSDPDDDSFAWNMGLYDGHVEHTEKSLGLFARCVRDGS